MNDSAIKRIESVLTSGYSVQNFVEFWGLTPAEMMKNYLAIRGSSKEERDELRASIAKMEEEQSK